MFLKFETPIGKIIKQLFKDLEITELKKYDKAAMSGEGVEHINYNILATQNGEVVLEANDVHDHDGINDHMTAPLPAATSDDTPVEVEVIFNGYGLPDGEKTGPIGQVTTMQVVPEFGTIAMMILAVAIISIVAVTAKSRVVPRF